MESMVNLCHFPAVIAGQRFESAASPVWQPILGPGSHPVYPVLLGFYEPVLRNELPVGTPVLVARFAAAVGWARKWGLKPYCLPLTTLPGEGKQPDGSWVASGVEEAPEGLGLSFLRHASNALALPEDARIHRALPNYLTVQVQDGPDLPPVPVAQQAFRREDGSVHVPNLPTNTGGFDAILVPQDGAIVTAVAREYPDHAILVTDVFVPGKRTRLFQVR